MDHSDIVIIGGGLAGLSLALQLRARHPQRSIRVLERRRHPLPVAAHKVGESTVEIGAHYLADTIGLRNHLDSQHLRKFGFRFFWSEGRRDLENVTELGVRRVLPTPTWQIDRGILENHMGEVARAQAIDFVDDCTVQGIDLGSGADHHQLRYRVDGQVHELGAGWLIDASGRAGLLKRKLGLAQGNDHDANAVWFRINDRLAIDEWCADPEWSGRCDPPERWRSTNHLVGPGYWVWLIPLSSGAHSVGIVCDAQMHPLESMNDFDKALDWLHRHQPLVADHVEQRRDRLMDFLYFRRFSYGCKQVFSADRWALTGEAGLFLDPFYSPGSDFIAIANTYIVELIDRELRDEPIAGHARLFEQLYRSFYENTLSLYQDQYPLFGNAQVMPVKVIWDYTYYWGVLCVLVFQQRLTDTALLAELAPELAQASALNRQMQAALRHWHHRGGDDNRACMLDQGGLAWFHALNRQLHEPLDDAGVRQRLRDNVALLTRLAATIQARAEGGVPAPDPIELFDHATAA